MTPTVTSEDLLAALGNGPVAVPTPCGWSALAAARDRARLVELAADPARVALTAANVERLAEYLPPLGLRARRLIARLLPGPVALRLGDAPWIELPAAPAWSALAGSGDPYLVAPLQRDGDLLWPGDEVARRWPDLALLAGAGPRLPQAEIMVDGARVEVLAPGVLDAATLAEAGRLRLLCVCSGNTCRSPMMAALLRAALHGAEIADVLVESAGTYAYDGDAASTHAIAAMAARGIDLSAHRSRNAGELDLAAYDRIYCMSRSHAQALAQLGADPARIEAIGGHGGVADPYGGNLDDYERTAAQLERIAAEIVAQV